MKHYVNLVAIFALVAATVVSCDKYDDSAIKADLSSLSGRVSALESKVDAANSNISALKSSVSVLEGKTSVSGVEQTSDGYVIKFSDGKSVTIKNGENGSTPAVGIKKDADGNYYWTLDGEWLLSDGKKVLAGQSSPRLKIEGGKWMVSVDDGKTWADAAPSSEYVIFKSVDISDPAFVVLTLQDGTVLKLTRGTSGVQSIAAIPSYSDGSVKITEGTSTLRFDVFPAGAAGALAALPLDKFEVKVVYTQTKAEAGDKTALSVTGVSSEGGELLVTVDGSSLDKAFFIGSISASALLVVNDGAACVQSGYFSLGVKACEAVDLGLSVMWAKFNVGAASPEEFGDYYVYGETEPYYEDGYAMEDPQAHWKPEKKDGYTWRSYLWCNGSVSTMMKYCVSSGSGMIDNKTVLEENDDVAYVKWGSNWRMPTAAEWEELLTKCRLSFIDNYNGTGIAGMTVTGSNGNTIFLPAAGTRSESSLRLIGTNGYYRSSSVDISASSYATICAFTSGGANNTNALRYTGLSIRPVYGEYVKASSISLDKTTLNLNIGESFPLTATLQPSNCLEKNVIWSSSKNSVAKVDRSSGRVSALNVGTATITVTWIGDKSITANCTVKVNDPASSAVDLSASGTANCYIVPEAGTYRFNATVKGGSSESVGTPASAEVLWESFGTSTAPSVGDLVNNVSYASGEVTFTATSAKGNAVIAVKDASGNILWSWHIWLTDQPAEQVYNNNAGTVMDRNLGATSATKGDVHALGLLYQWGRKDPFLASSSLSDRTVAASTIATWPAPAWSDKSHGTIAYAIANPTTFIKYNTTNGDWYYTGSSSTDDTRWQSSKGMYDPCPQGWRVPDGGIWAKAFGTSSSWTKSTNWDSTNCGYDFGSTDKKLGSGIIWYPAAGIYDREFGSLTNPGAQGEYSSCTPNSKNAYRLGFVDDGDVRPSDYNMRAYGQSVRCVSER